MNLPHEIDELHHLINETALALNLDSLAVIEKDFYVTRALHGIANVDTAYCSLVFHGGTALAKAYKLVERMSEDCDFRIHTTAAWQTLNGSQRRHELRNYRHSLLSQLEGMGFTLADEGIKVRDEGNYFQFNLCYPSLYQTQDVLRPHLQLEFMAVNSRLPTTVQSVTTLIRQTLGEAIAHEETLLTCVCVNETAAEKWVALTRRVANAMRKPDIFPDPTLVRHIYDLYCMGEKQQIGQETYSLITTLIEEDASRYKNQNSHYVQNPVAEIKGALSLLATSKEWEKNWYDFMKSMVYSERKPDYPTAISHLQQLSQPILAQLSSQEARVSTLKWYQMISPAEIKILSIHSDSLLKEIGGYLQAANHKKDPLDKTGAQTEELLCLLTKAVLKDPIKAPLLTQCAPEFSKKAQSYFSLSNQERTLIQQY